MYGGCRCAYVNAFSYNCDGPNLAVLVPKRCLKHTNLQSTDIGCFYTQQAGSNMEEQSNEEAEAIRGQAAS